MTEGDKPAWRRLAESPIYEINLKFRGSIRLYNPPRPEPRGAVEKCLEAGIAMYMLTGDHIGTTKAITTQVGIIPSKVNRFSEVIANALVIVAEDFDRLSNEQVVGLPVSPSCRHALHSKYLILHDRSSPSKREILRNERRRRQ